MVIVPFKPEHLDTFRPGSVERAYWPLPSPPLLIGKAWSVVEAGRCWGIGGVFNGRASLLLSDELRARKWTLHRIAKKILRNFDVLEASSRDERSDRWLSRLGFVHVGEGIYRYERH